MANLFNGDFGSTTPDNLFSGGPHPTDIRSITVASGQGILKRGTVIGIVTASGKGKKVNSVSTDGSQTANCILTDEINTVAADVVTTAYVSGAFNRQALLFGGTDTTATHETQLRSLGIYLKDNQEYKE